MSARPDVPRLAPEDLDLLISRSLDGDLSPEEEQQLERLVAVDPAAARRKAELAALVAQVKALPEVAAPFAIATRVNANVAERGGRPGSLGGRVGFFPAPGFAKAALVVLALVGVAIALLRPAPKQLAEGPVDVLLYDARPAVSALLLPRRSSRRRSRRRAPGTGRAGRRPTSAGTKYGKSRPGCPRTRSRSRRSPPRTRPRRQSRSSRPKPRRSRRRRLRSSTGVTSTAVSSPRRPRRSRPRVPSPRPRRRGPPPARWAHRGRQAARGWTVSVRGDAARRWALRRAPDSYPAAHSGSACRLPRRARRGRPRRRGTARRHGLGRAGRSPTSSAA